MATDKNRHLQEVLDSHKMSKVEAMLEKCNSKREKVKEAIEIKYSGKIASSPINSGSFAKHTAINKKFDLDLCTPFLRDSFITLEEMADELFKFFDEEYIDNDLQKPIRKQRVSIGLDFKINDHIIGMDVVPGREINQSEYQDTNDLNLFVRAKDGVPKTETKTNIKKHINEISGRNSERDIIRLIKVWKYYNGKNLKSFLIELIVIRAFDDNINEIPNGLWEKTEFVLNFIKNNIETIKITDPANSNNIVSNTLSKEEKKAISNDIEIMLSQIENNSDLIKVYFKINPDFPSTSGGQYSKKANEPSILKTQSFG
jgi:hypothetical protein